MSLYKIGHLEIDSPWGNAGGVVKTPEEVELMAHAGVGWVEAGSYTLEPRTGNSPNGEIVYYHDSNTGETFNSLGMPNKGIDAVEKQIPEMANIAHSLDKKLVVNVAPVSEEPISESQELTARAYAAGADAVLLNASCPNVVTASGGRHEILSHSPEMFGRVIVGLSQTIEKYHRPIFARISPQENYAATRELLRTVSSKLVSAIFTPNTWPNNIPVDENNDEILEVPDGKGGKSGPATAEAAFKQTLWAMAAAKKSGGRQIDVVSSGGITTGQELQKRIHGGAAAGAGTTLYYESVEEGWSEATDRLLWQYHEAS